VTLIFYSLDLVIINVILLAIGYQVLLLSQ